MSTSDPDIGPLIAILAGRPLDTDALTDAEWERLHSRAIAHDLAPIVYARLKTRGAEPPPAIAAQLRQAYYDSAERNIVRFDELGKVLVAMDAARIPVVLLKGSATQGPVDPVAEQTLNHAVPLSHPDLLGRGLTAAGSPDFRAVS